MTIMEMHAGLKRALHNNAVADVMKAKWILRGLMDLFFSGYFRPTISGFVPPDIYILFADQLLLLIFKYGYSSERPDLHVTPPLSKENGFTRTKGEAKE